MLVRSKQRWRDPSLCAATIGISVSETWCCFFEKMSLAELTREWPEWSSDCLDGERVMPAWLGLERHGAGGLRVIGAGSVWELAGQLCHGGICDLPFGSVVGCHLG